MAALQNKLDEVRIPFQQMSFTPDVPSTALGPNEYNEGLNVETDVRGIRSIAGDQEILDSVPGTPTFVTGGYRLQGEFWFVVATTEGYWWASNGGAWQNITPGGGPFTGYAQNTNITEAWNGTVPFFNDTINAPFFWPDESGAIMVLYSNLVLPTAVDAITVGVDTVTITFYDTYATAPYIAGQKILVSGINNYYNGTFTVQSSTTTDVTYYAVPGSAPPSPIPDAALVSPAYTWNYNPNWKSVIATFLRIYSTPNVGSILVAGNLTATLLDDTTVNYPVTVQWSQAFGLNEAPLTWQPTITNVANQLEVPLRGPAIDAFPSNGQFFLCSYWDTVVFSPINYSTTSAPILGVRLYNQGRGMLSSNCWANTDKEVYGIDARDIWVFNGQDFKGIGNQRVKNWFYDQLDQQYVDRIFMEVNTQKNQVEIFYTDIHADPANNGVPNKMISYRYDLDCWNAPRDVLSATFSCESPIWTGNTANYGSRTIVYARGEGNVKLIQKDQGYSFVSTATNTWGNIASHFRRDNIKMIKDYSGKLLVHRILPEVVNLDSKGVEVNPGTGNLTVGIEGANSVGGSRTVVSSSSITVDTDYPWIQFNQNAYRVNSVELSNSSNVAIWMCNAITWQYTQVEDDH